MSATVNYHRGLHRFASALAGAVVLLIAAGGLVKSLEAGLSVPDWPLSYGSLNPPRWWQIENVRAEHGHRLLAGTIALLTVALAVWVQRKEDRAWVRRLAWLAVAAVLAQALLGGITVLFFLPTAISVSHAGLAQLFLCMVTTVAVVTSRRWLDASAPGDHKAHVRPLMKHAWGLTILIYLQILVGAVMRHTGAGLAIPDFPLVFGGLVPGEWSFPIAVHYTHRFGALLVTLAILWLLARLMRGRQAGVAPVWPGVLLAGLVALQVTLGGFVVLTARSPLVNTIHVATGAALLAASLVLSLSLSRAAGPRVDGEGVA